MTGIADELARLAELRDRGVLTEEEFQAQKAAMLSSQRGGGGTPAPTNAWKWVSLGCLGMVGLVMLVPIVGIIVGDRTPSGLVIQASDLAGEWPIAVPAPVTVDCGDGLTTLFLEAGGRAYPLNQSGRSRPETYTGKLGLAPDAARLLKPGAGGAAYPLDGLIATAIQRCRQAGRSAM